jgi:hypothetical protein
LEAGSVPFGPNFRNLTFGEPSSGFTPGPRSASALYLKGSPSNLSKAQTVLDLFCLASGAKINWGKSAAIWANKDKKEWEWGQEVGLKWIPEGQGV